MGPDAWLLVGFFFFGLILRLKVQFSSTQRFSHLTLGLYEKRLTHRDIVIGVNEIPMHVASQNGPSLFEFPIRSTNIRTSRA